MPSLPTDFEHAPSQGVLRAPLVVLMGPTAVGKTELAIRLAERLEGEIVSADSRLFYRGMDLGTAKPSLIDLQRVPHHLIDVAEPDEIWSLALFQQRAREAIAGIRARNRLPFLVGGTGQYVRAVTQGWQGPAVEPAPQLRQALEHWADEIGKQGLYDRLTLLDPAAAAGIDPRNLRRTVRALEVILSSGRRFSDQRRRSSSPYDLLQIGLIRPRRELYARIDTRVDAMLAAGLVDEVRGLLAKGYSPDLPTMSAIGYSEVIAYLGGRLSLNECAMEIKRATRILVRRQANWFKPDDPHIHWFQADADPLREIEQLIRDFLKWVEINLANPAIPEKRN
jgi:tRNA dimethylallyltransferase